MVERELNHAAGLIARLMAQHRRQFDAERCFDGGHQLSGPVRELERPVGAIGVNQIVGRERQRVLPGISPGPSSSGVVELVINRWSTAGERDRLMEVLKSRGPE